VDGKQQAHSAEVTAGQHLLNDTKRCQTVFIMLTFNFVSHTKAPKKPHFLKILCKYDEFTQFCSVFLSLSNQLSNILNNSLFDCFYCSFSARLSRFASGQYECLITPIGWATQRQISYHLCWSHIEYIQLSIRST
jgi:hypothetical protein